MKQLTAEEAQELMERNGFTCTLIADKTVPVVKHPAPGERARLIELAGEHGLACHIYPRWIVLVPIAAARVKMAAMLRDQGFDVTKPIRLRDVKDTFG